VEDATYGEEGDVEDRNVQSHAERNSTDKVHVLPHWQAEQALILRQRVHRVEHLDSDENGQRHSRCGPGVLVREHLTSDLGELGRALVEVRLQLPHPSVQ
jgi:hypothetical protein